MPAHTHVVPNVTDPLEPAFTRGQVEWALWRLEPVNERRMPTTRFKIKVKHLLELDRSEPLPAPRPSLAFSDEPAAGRGEHSLFSVFDAFMLEAGMSLLEVGFKRKDVVLYLRSRRDRWRRLGPVLATGLKTAAHELSVGHRRQMSKPDEEIILKIPAIDSAASRGNDNLYLAADFKQMLAAAFPRVIVLDLSFAGHHLPYLLLKAPLRRRGPS